MVTGLPTKLRVDLFGKAKKAQFPRQGIYILQQNHINGRQYYVQESGLNGFWFVEAKWMLGDIKKLGEYYGSIQVLGDSVSPLNGQKWKYFNVDQWIESSNEIIISAGNFDSKKYLDIFCIYGKN